MKPDPVFIIGRETEEADALAMAAWTDDRLRAAINTARNLLTERQIARDGLEPYRERFDTKWREDPETGCWNWSAARMPKGYGHLWIGKRFERAHRFSYMLHHGPIPSGLQVCHRCDNARCVNPAHLWLGTVRENAEDRVAKGRGRNGVLFGPDNPATKLTEAAVRTIRETPNTYGSGVVLARRFGVSPATITRIRSGRARRAA